MDLVGTDSVGIEDPGIRGFVDSAGDVSSDPADVAKIPEAVDAAIDADTVIKEDSNGD